MTGKQIYEALLSYGSIFILDKHYYGKAGDGLEVVLGTVGDETPMYRYLEDFPSPTDW